MKMKLFDRSVFTEVSASDPLRYYYEPLTKHFYRGRLERGLALLLKKRYRRMLEIGYGSGILLPTLAGLCDELHGADIHQYGQKIARDLQTQGVASALVAGDVRSLPYPDNHFDAVLAFSIFEHLNDLAVPLREVRRILMKGGEVLIGIPRLDAVMTFLFLCMGYRDIGKHHIGSEREIGAAIRRVFPSVRVVSFPPFVPRLCHLYTYYHAIKE